MKVAIARALVHDPPNVMLDEPTNGLDVMTTRSLREVIRRLREAGKCVLFSSHVMQEVSALCDDDRDRRARRGGGERHRARSCSRRAAAPTSRTPSCTSPGDGGRGRHEARSAWSCSCKELRDALRDRRTALMVLVASILTGPVTLVLVAQFVSGLEEKASTLKVRMVGQEHAPALVNFLQRAATSRSRPRPPTTRRGSRKAGSTR